MKTELINLTVRDRRPIIALIECKEIYPGLNYDATWYDYLLEEPVKKEILCIRFTTEIHLLSQAQVKKLNEAIQEILNFKRQFTKEEWQDEFYEIHS